MKKRYWMPLLAVLAVPLGFYVFLQFPVFGAHPTASNRADYADSEAFNVTKGEFENRRPELMDNMREQSSLFGMLQEWFSEREASRPSVKMPEVAPDIAEFVKPDAHTKLIWLGHSSFILNIAGTIVLVDPVFSAYAAPVSFTAQRFQSPVLSLQQLPKIDLVLISHDHYDHLDKDTIKHFVQTDTTFVMPIGVGLHLKRWGIAEDLIVEKDWWDSFDFNGITFTAAPAQHFSGRDGINNNETLWASWVVISPQSRLYFSGDSGYDNHFKQVGERFGPFDLSIMENGQYDKAWPVVHLFPAETVQAHRDVKAKRLMPVHWGMFELAFHTWFDPVESLSALADAEGIELVTPMLGQVITLNDDISTQRWWQNMM